MYVIKEFEDGYNEKVNNFIISIFVEEYGFEECRKELEEQDNFEYIKNGGKLWMALDEQDNIIGTIALVRHSNEDVELKKLYVKKDYRGKGLSKELYSKVIETTEQQEFKRIFLGTYQKLETAINFYLKRGFKKIDELDEEESGARYFELYI